MISCHRHDIMSWRHFNKCPSAISVNNSIHELHQHNLFDHVICWWLRDMHMITAYADNNGICRWRHMQMITWHAETTKWRKWNIINIINTLICAWLINAFNSLHNLKSSTSPVDGNRVQIRRNCLTATFLEFARHYWPSTVTPSRRDADMRFRSWCRVIVSPRTNFPVGIYGYYRSTQNSLRYYLVFIVFAAKTSTAYIQVASREGLLEKASIGRPLAITWKNSIV